MFDSTSGVGMFLTHTAAAGAAEFPTFYGSIRKSARQSGEAVPRMGVREFVHTSLKGSAAAAAIVGGQLLTQSRLEERLSSTTAASLAVATASAPLMALHNGYSMGYSWRKTWQRFTLRQVGVITTREFFFIQGVALSRPLRECLEERYGERPEVRWTASLISGAVGGTFGHPADTILTCQQKGVPLPRGRQLMRGLMPRTAGIAAFNLLYNEIIEAVKRYRVRPED